MCTICGSVDSLENVKVRKSGEWKAIGQDVSFARNYSGREFVPNCEHCARSQNFA